jgi:hypothetical protein
MSTATPGQAARWRKRPVVVDAVQWTGDNLDEIYEFAGCENFDMLDEQDRANCDDPEATASVFDKLHSTWVLVYTGQWVIRGIKGEFYPCADDVFRETYEPAAQEPHAPGLAAPPHAAATLLFEAFELIANAVPFEPNSAEQWERRKREWVTAWHAYRDEQEQPAPELAALDLDQAAEVRKALEAVNVTRAAVAPELAAAMRETRAVADACRPVLDCFKRASDGWRGRISGVVLMRAYRAIGPVPPELKHLEGQ